ncbi:MAG: DUF2062 domain-containing protein [Pseudomonadota bacterium]
MKKFLNQWLPKKETLEKNRYLRALFLNKKTARLWHINRRAVAKGVACGLLVCFLPIPGQTVLAVLLAILLCANLPVAILATWASNPFTFVPFNILIYQVGAWVLGVEWHSESFHGFSHDTLVWFFSMGKVYAVGLAIVSILSALLGYLLVQLGWRLAIYWRRKHKHTRIQN